LNTDGPLALWFVMTAAIMRMMAKHHVNNGDLRMVLLLKSDLLLT
jgi:hypothetical protein